MTKRGRPTVDTSGTEAVTIVLPTSHVALLREWAAEEFGASHRYGGLVRGAVRRMLEEHKLIEPRASQLTLRLPPAVVCPPVGALRTVSMDGRKKVGCAFEYCPTRRVARGECFAVTLRPALRQTHVSADEFARELALENERSSAREMTPAQKKSANALEGKGRNR